MNDDDIVMLKPGDPCPLCGEPIQTDDEGALHALTVIRECLEIADVAALSFRFLREMTEGAP